jgi:hypothetical protein
MNERPVEWLATHSGWLLIAPILLAEVDDYAPVPIPRWGLERWFEANLWFNDYVINAVIGMIAPDAVGYLFWGVRELKQPRIVRVNN